MLVVNSHWSIHHIQFLGVCYIADIGKKIVIAFISDDIDIKHTFQQFPAVYVDLDIEREPYLYFDEHEAEFLIQIIEVIAETVEPPCWD